MTGIMHPRRLKLLSGAVIAAAGVVHHASSADAAPVFNMKVQGRNVTDGGYFSTTLDPFTANIGDVIEYQVIVNIAPIGTVYTGSPGFTITSLTEGPDGSNSLRATLFELTTDEIQLDLSVGALQNGWEASVANMVGSMAPRGNGNDDITGINAARAPADFSGLEEEVIYTGSATVTSNSGNFGAGSGPLLRVRWGSGNGSVHVNGSGLPRFPFLQTETGTAPFLNYEPLSWSVPEPSSVALLGAAALGLLGKRRGRS